MTVAYLYDNRRHVKSDIVSRSFCLVACSKYKTRPILNSKIQAIICMYRLSLDCFNMDNLAVSLSLFPEISKAVISNLRSYSKQLTNS